MEIFHTIKLSMPLLEDNRSKSNIVKEIIVYLLNFEIVRLYQPFVDLYQTIRKKLHITSTKRL